ncbi:hypothetical protein CEH05_20500 (plasmid) [Halobacillus halophilus]|uniref:hypothetical protein n=1 Tax=Halobacillus halophilus TaxID=1570 RepID=UPI000B51BF41|nr:hypothetical protein [Halobacillus halophilus]ASF41574.1 hypothetical protein CEH05_20500 [Halobacillus halophilus]
MGGAKNKRMVFNKAREIEKERDGAATKRDNLEKRAKDAKAQLELSKKKYEDELKKGVQAGEDNTEKLNELADEIDQKEKLAARRANEAAIGRQHFKKKTPRPPPIKTRSKSLFVNGNENTRIRKSSRNSRKSERLRRSSPTHTKAIRMRPTITRGKKRPHSH